MLGDQVRMSKNDEFHGPYDSDPTKYDPKGHAEYIHRHFRLLRGHSRNEILNVYYWVDRGNKPFRG